MSSTLISRGKQILDYEKRIQELQAAKKNSISELNAALRQLETDRTRLREELNAKVTAYKPRKEESSKASSLSSILSLKFGTANPKHDIDPMSDINARRQRIEKMDSLIAQNIDLRKKEEDRQIQIQKMNKEIRRIVDTITEIKRTDEQKSKTEIWCINTITRLSDEVNDAKLSIDSYQKAIPLLIEAQKSIELIINISDQNTADDHLQKLAINQLESNSLIADTCLAQAWNYLSIADPNHEDNVSALPPLPDDIYTWAREVYPIVQELLQAANLCISKKEKIIVDHEAELLIIQEKLFEERKLVFIEAANGAKPNPPSYNDLGPIRRANTSLPKSNNVKVLSKSSDNLPPLPPRTQSVSLHSSRQSLVQEQKRPMNVPTKSNLPFDMTGFSFPTETDSDAHENAKNGSFEESLQKSGNSESLQKSGNSSFSFSDSLSHKWDDDISNVPKYDLSQSQTDNTQSIIEEEPINDKWPSDSTFDHSHPNQQLKPGRPEPTQESWSKLTDDIPKEVSYELPKEVDSAIERETTIAEKMDEMYLENNQKLPKLSKPSSMMGLDDNPWN